MINRYAVMGNPIQHSLSPAIHQLFAEQTGCLLQYDKILIDESCFEQQVKQFFHQGGQGLNITLPCKQRAFLMADVASQRCQQAKAANTLWSINDKLYADNTDGIGLIRDLTRYLDLQDKRILLLGAGGAARGILGPLLAQQPAWLTVANRTLATAQALQEDFAISASCDFETLTGTFEVIINATAASLSMQALPISAIMIKKATLCYDLAYKAQGQTPFVMQVNALGGQAIDGLGMLIEQAAEAFNIWHGIRPETLSVLQHFRRMQ